MGSKEPLGIGKGGAFKVEANNRAVRTNDGARDTLDSYGSIGRIIERVISNGAYISFGSTADGGALLIRVLDGDKKLSSYCHSKQDILEALQALEDRYPGRGVTGNVPGQLELPK